VYTGARASPILVSDLRLSAHHIVCTLPQHNTHFIHLNTDNHTLISASLTGQLELIDLRQRRGVLGYAGNVNTHMRAPTVVDEQGDVLAAGACSLGRAAFNAWHPPLFSWLRRRRPLLVDTHGCPPVRRAESATGHRSHEFTARVRVVATRWRARTNGTCDGVR
jgi:hypothetical protein